MHSGVSVTLVGSNSLTCTQITLQAELFINCEFYCRYLILIDAYTNGEILLGELLTSFSSVFELAWGLRPLE